MKAYRAIACLVVVAGCAAGPRGADTPVPAIVCLPVSADPTISLRLLFRVGSQDDPPGKEGLAALTAALMAEGATERRAYDRILEELYPMAAGYGAAVDKELTVFTGRVHKDHWTAYYELFRDAILHPAFTAEDFERLKSRTLNYLERELLFANDEELGKQALNRFVFAGTPYGHPEAGLAESVRALTVEDVKEFYRRHFTRDAVTVGLGGAVTEAMGRSIAGDLEALPATGPERPPVPQPQPIRGREVLLIEKDTASTAMSLGFPIDAVRDDVDFVALWLANSWFGEHRSSSSHLYQVIREARGLNYGDYSYIEAFPNGHARQFPPPNVARRQQLFQIWIRSVRNEAAHFALRAALRELRRLVERGLTAEEFELTQRFLVKYCRHFAPGTSVRLGYRLDDRFYGLGESFLETLSACVARLTLDEVNAAVKRHLGYENLKIVMVTEHAAALRQALVEDQPSPLHYETPKPASVLAEDKEIERYPLGIEAGAARIVPVEQAFRTGA